MLEYNYYQTAIINTELTYPGTSVCSIGGAVKLRSDIDTDILEKAAEKFIMETPLLKLRRHKGVPYISETFCGIKRLCVKTEEDAEKLIRGIISEPFGGDDTPLYEIGIVSSEQADYGYLKIHHILGDHISLYCFFKRIEKIYRYLASGDDLKTVPDKRYINNMLIKRYEPDNAAKAYFEDMLSGVDIKTVYNHLSDISSGIYEYSQPNAKGITDFCRENSIRPDAVYYAALTVYMNTVKGVENPVFGAMMMNRGIKENNVFGLYANTIPVILKNTHNFRELCTIADKQLKESAKYCGYPAEMIYKDNGINGRCYDVAVSYISMGMLHRISLGEIKRFYSGYCEIPVRLNIFRRKSEINITVEYSVSLFERQYIENFMNCISGIINRGIDGEDDGVLSADDIRSYDILNGGYKDYPEKTIVNEFIEYAKLHSQETAYIYGGKEVSYSDALKRASAVAKALEGRSIVAVSSHRSEYLISSILGVMMSGAAYFPFMPGRGAPPLCDAVIAVSEECIDGAVCADLLDTDVQITEDRSSPEKAAYYMSTSGTSGKPKTVIISHYSLYERIRWMHDRYGLNRRILAKTPPTFDVSGWELLACAFGGTSILTEDGEEKDPVSINRYIDRYGIEIVHFVPSMLKAYEDYAGIKVSDSIEDVFSSGERLGIKEAEGMRRVFPGAKLHNLYGPSECTIDVTYYDCNSSENIIPIGRPVANTEIYIVNDSGDIMPRSEEGEILVSGELVGMGYAEDGGGYTEFRGERAYRTGDIGYLGFDENIYFVGRNDSQVKLGGKRTDLYELENAASRVDGVKNCAAVYANGRIYLYYTAESPIKSFMDKLFTYTERLPSAAVYIKEMPVTDHGKLDIEKLKNTVIKGTEEKPETYKEKAIYEAVLSELNRSGIIYESIGVNDILTDIGLDSLSILSVITKLNSEGFSFTVQDFYRSRTIRALSSEKGKRKYALLKKTGKKSCIICFPYAGGTAESFEKIANDADRDVIAIDYDGFDEDESVSTISEFCADLIIGYESIIIAASCIGAAYAAELSFILNVRGRETDGIYLFGSLPQKTPNGKNPWRILGEERINTVLSKLTGRSIPENAPVSSFLRDTDRYFKYMNGINRKVNARVYASYAVHDKFTGDYRRKNKRWSRIFGAEPLIYEIDGSDHYFFVTEDNIIKRMAEVEENV